MKRPRNLIVVAALALSVAAAMFLVDGSRKGTSTAPQSVSATFDNNEARTLGQSTADLQRHLQSRDEDWLAWGRLGFAYIEEARVTANPALYPKAQGAFERSLALNPADNFAALAGQGALANARHDFAAGLAWGERARTLNPASPEVQAVVGDALLELGRYDEAFAAYQKMVDLAPGLAAYTRAAFALELQGDVGGARRTLELALGDALSPRDRAFAASTLGELAWNGGHLEEAQQRYEEAATADPDLVSAQAGLARLAAARGDPGAVRRWGDVVARAPLPEYVAELANLHLSHGRTAEAETQVALLGVQRRLLEANGVNGDLELALFSADHQTDLPSGLRAAKDEWARRQSIHVADALAWQLHAHGRHQEALKMADQGLRLGTRSALFHFHRGMIRHALGDLDGARSDLSEALKLNPHFSTLHARTATETLTTLGAP